MKKTIIMIASILLSTSVIHAQTNTHLPKPRIIGGKASEIGAWQWMAGIVYSDMPAYSGFYCGASLIHPGWVITAAHCVKNNRNIDMKPEEIDIVIAVNDLENDLNNGIGERIKAKQIISNSYYDHFTMDSDIALIELEHDSSYTPIMPVEEETFIDGMDAIVMGWGDTDPSYLKNYPPELQEIIVQIVSNEECLESFGEVPDDFVTENMVCAGDISGNKDACNGDSGGPMIIKDENIWKLAGIVSWGQGCAVPGYYGVYTRISKFNEWIDQYIIRGDLSKNGKVGIEDAVGILNAISNSYFISLRGDINKDNKADLKDVMKILQMITY